MKRPRRALASETEKRVETRRARVGLPVKRAKQTAGLCRGRKRDSIPVVRIVAIVGTALAAVPVSLDAA